MIGELKCVLMCNAVKLFRDDSKVKQMVLLYVGAGVIFNKKTEIYPGDTRGFIDWSVL